MKIGDHVSLQLSGCYGKVGTLCSFGPLSDSEPWAVVRLVDHPEWCRRVPLNNLRVIPNYLPPAEQRLGSVPLAELPRDWAWALV